MTGFSRQSADTPAGTMTWELRAVNHRYLDVQFRLPDELRPKEAEFKQQVSAVLSRGKVECALHLKRAFDQQSELQLNPEVVELVGTRITEIRNVVPDAAPKENIEALVDFMWEFTEMDRDDPETWYRPADGPSI